MTWSCLTQPLHVAGHDPEPVARDAHHPIQAVRRSGRHDLRADSSVPCRAIRARPRSRSPARRFAPTRDRQIPPRQGCPSSCRPPRRAGLRPARPSDLSLSSPLPCGRLARCAAQSILTSDPCYLTIDRIRRSVHENLAIRLQWVRTNRRRGVDQEGSTSAAGRAAERR